MSSDERLARRAAQGDKRAFEEIYERYHQDLYRFCMAMVGNPQDAQDTLQNTMLKVLRGLPGEKREIRLKPWLYRIARNEGVETLRKRRDSVELEPQLAAVVGISETAETRERLRTLLADLEQLPERQRAALVMRELADLDFEQIGAAFGSSAAVARQTLYEARLSLRQLEAGREMHCEEVMRELSDADGRVTRRREIQAHLRSCSDCRAFRDQIAKRHEDLAALAPLPVAASAGLLHGVLGAKASGVAGGVSSAGGVAATTGAGKIVATSTIVKSVATVAAAVVIGASAERSGLVNLPLPRTSEHAEVQGDTGANQRSTSNGQTGTDEQSPEAKGQASEAAGSRSHAGNDQSKGQQETSGKAKNASGGNRSKSNAGSTPPGGGYGRSAADRRGRPEKPPEAAAHGQQTATQQKSPHATAAGKQADGGESHGPPSGAGASPPPKHAPPKAQSPAVTPPAGKPPVEAPPEANKGSGKSAQGSPSPELER